MIVPCSLAPDIDATESAGCGLRVGQVLGPEVGLEPGDVGKRDVAPLAPQCLLEHRLGVAGVHPDRAVRRDRTCSPNFGTATPEARANQRTISTYFTEIAPLAEASRGELAKGMSGHLTSDVLRREEERRGEAVPMLLRLERAGVKVLRDYVEVEPLHRRDRMEPWRESNGQIHMQGRKG